MKTLHIPQFRPIVITLLACLITPLMGQSSDLPPLPPGQTYTEEGVMVPSDGAGGGGRFQPDSGPPGLPNGGTGGGGGGGGGGSGCTNCTNVNYGYGFYLSIALGPASNTVVITLHNTTNGLPYLLESATNLLGPWFTNQSLLATNISPNTNMVAQPIALEDYEGLYIRGLQATPGQLRWAVELVNIATSTNYDNFGPGLDSAPSLSPDGQTIYMTTPNHTISAIDAATGMILWTDCIFTYSTNVSPEPPDGMGCCTLLRYGGRTAGSSVPYTVGLPLPSGGINMGLTDGHAEYTKLNNLWTYTWHLNWNPALVTGP